MRLFLPKKIDMAEIITQIPGFEKGRVQCIYATDEVSESFLVSQMADIIRQKWNTSVLCISLDGHKDDIESLIPKEKAIGNVYVLDQKNTTIDLVLRKAKGIINRRFIRALIISGAERLTTRTYKDSPDKGQELINHCLNGLARDKKIPIILVENKEEPIEQKS